MIDSYLKKFFKFSFQITSAKAPKSTMYHSWILSGGPYFFLQIIDLDSETHAKRQV